MHFFWEHKLNTWRGRIAYWGKSRDEVKVHMVHTIIWDHISGHVGLKPSDTFCNTLVLSPWMRQVAICGRGNAAIQIYNFVYGNKVLQNSRMPQKMHYKESSDGLGM